MTETLMILDELIGTLEILREGLGGETLVDVDLVFLTGDPEVLATIKAGMHGQPYLVKQVESDKPAFRPQGEQLVAERLQEYIQAAQYILAGLDGQPFTWHEGRRRSLGWKARHMGATLITPTYAKELGLRPKEGEQPVGQGEYEWGSRRRSRPSWGQLYVMECQLEKIPVDSGPSTEAVQEEIHDS